MDILVCVSSERREWRDFFPPIHESLLFILLALFERRAHSSFYMIPCFLSQLPYFFQRVFSMNSPSYPQHFTFLIYVTLPILPRLSTYIMSTFPHLLWSTSIGCGATPPELVEILLSTVFANCRIRYKPTYMSHSTIRHTTTKV